MNWSGILAGIGIALLRNKPRAGLHESADKVYDHSIPLFESVVETYRDTKPELSQAAILALGGKMAEAKKLFAKVLNLSTDNPDLCLLACQIYQALWMNDLVEKFVLRGMELTPGDPDALIRFHPYFPNNIVNGLRTHALTVDDCLKVANDLKHDMIAEWNCMNWAMELDDQNAEVCLRFVEQCVNGDNGDGYDWQDDAEKLFRIAHRAQELAPNDPAPAYLLAEMEYQHSWDKEGDYSDALKWILRAIELNPNRPEYYELKFYILDELGRPDEKIPDLRHYAELTPTYPSGDPYLAAASLAASGGDLAKAEEFRQKAIERAEGDTKRLRAIGDHFAFLGDFDQAETFYLRALELREDNENWCRATAQSLSAIGCLREAAPLFERVVALQSDRFFHHYDGAIEAYYGLGDLSKVEQLFEQQLAGRVLGTAQVQFGQFLRETGHKVRSEVAFAKAKASGLFSTFEREMLNKALSRPEGDYVSAQGSPTSLGAFFLARRMPNAAIHHYRIALKQEPNKLENLVGMGSTLAAFGRIAAAERYYAQALELDPRCIDVYLGRARIAASNNKLEEAAANYRQALELEPENLLIQEKLAELASGR